MKREKKFCLQMNWSLLMNNNVDKNGQQLSRFVEKEIPMVEQVIKNKIETITNCSLQEAMNYSLNAGGKKIRPLLLLSTLVALGGKAELGYDTAVALEFVHTYSLIHDDLPAMDDDDMRRGKPTNHIVFGSSTAILAGDGLLTQAFQIITESSISTEKKIQLVQGLSQAAGPNGMVAGQIEDMEGETRQLSLNELKKVHQKKTGALLKFAVFAGGLLADASSEVQELMTGYADNLGLAYQIRDDILDVIGNIKKLGKETGKDESRNKSTYPRLLTLAGAKKELAKTLASAREKLKKAENICSKEEKDTAFGLLYQMINLIELSNEEEYK